MDLLMVVFVVLVVLWAVGVLALPVFAGPWIHVLLVLALILIVIRLLRGQRL